MNKEIMYMRCATNLHMGAENEIGFVDMPIQREKHTGIPKMESSGIKGVLSREVKSELLFGKGSEEGGEASAGNLRIYDGRVLFFPVRSNCNSFVYVTCPFVLQRYLNESNKESRIPFEIYNDKALVSFVRSNMAIADFTFRYKKDSRIKTELSGIKDEFIDYLKDKEIVIVSNDVFSYFMEMGTVVRTRNKINSKTGVAENLFSVEYLPEETILYSVLEYEKDTKIKEEYDEFRTYITNKEYIQIGGEGSLGKGITQIRIGDLKDDNTSK